MENLKSYINAILHVSTDEWQEIEACAVHRTLKKGEILVQKNARFNQEVFVESGILRAFLVDEEGNEKSTGFFLEREFMGMSTLRTKNGCSIYDYQALSPASVVLLDATKFRSVLGKSPKLTALGRLLKEKEKDRLLARDECLLQMKGIDKYQKFSTCYPGLEDLISHQHIASYLGITHISLSRIRKKCKDLGTVNN